ncbi:type II toxin-antitoxin system HicA family toxin [Gloeocapsopsis dulcis]|uniref:type II toxin-antitoxin system HicA family toxin n=1 Tax=Gloeocapsopsis dulcis TaxID=2859516 RepID=UPI002B25C788|nr:type II toxin-antitoxin system HicA family toxin [Gloeocapsopsis dulcis]
MRFKLPRLPRLTAQDAEKLLFNAGFVLIRSKGSHRIYLRDNNRVVVPFHAGKVLHPKVVKQVLDAIEATD